MSWRLFFQIILLAIIIGAIFYIICPKYQYEQGVVRGNTITGTVKIYNGERWENP